MERRAFSQIQEVLDPPQLLVEVLTTAAEHLIVTITPVQGGVER